MRLLTGPFETERAARVPSIARPLAGVAATAALSGASATASAGTLTPAVSVALTGSSATTATDAPPGPGVVDTGTIPYLPGALARRQEPETQLPGGSVTHCQ